MKDPQIAERQQGQRVCLVSMEVIDPIFSGNGVASRSFSRGILSIPSTEVLVLCAQPTKKTLAGPAKCVDEEVGKALFGAGGTGNEMKGRLRGVAISVSKWGVTDRGSAWEEYGEGMECALVREAIASFNPTVFLCVDWTGWKAVQRMRASGVLTEVEGRGRIPEVYACFCMFHALYSISDHDRAFYRHAEGEAFAGAALSTVLSDVDAQCLAALDPALPPPSVILPPLRSDIAALVSPGSARRGWGEGAEEERRKYVTCCIRITEAKNVKVFCEAVAMISEQLKSGGFIPLLCGSGLKPKEPGGEVSAYARECKGALVAGCGWAEVEEDFLPPAAIFHKLSQTALNVHPAPYEAYGMTIVEAAAAGAPSLIHRHHRHVGAAQLLPPADHPQAGGGAVLTADTCDAAALASAIATALHDLPTLQATAQRAQELALGWQEEQFGARMCTLLHAVARLPAQTTTAAL